MTRTKTKKEQDREARAIVLAERVKLLFAFCADLIPDKDLLQEVMKSASENVGRTMSMEPILGAFGMDGEAMEFEARLRSKRASALFNLVDTIETTENERIEFASKQGAKAAGRAQLARALGL